MQIERIYYPVVALGPGLRIGIWTVGCPRACPGCTNPELWTSDPGRDVPVRQILRMVHAVGGPVDGFTLTGGEPFMQLRDLWELVRGLRRISPDILVYTGYTLDELLAMGEPLVHDILESIAVLVDGPYVDALNDGRSLRGSSNQRVHFFPTAHERLYQEYLDKPRTMQNVLAGSTALSIGLPLKGCGQRVRQGLSARGVVPVSQPLEFVEE